MTNPQSPDEYARHCVDLHTRGITCPRLVWDQFVSHATAETFPQFMGQLTPELQGYFRDVVLSSKACSQDEEQALSWLAAYYANKT